jgi:hypothetical protein
MGISSALGVISTAMNYASEQQQAESREAIDTYQAEVANNNQTIANQQAQSALEQGQVAEQQQQLKTAAMVGAARAQAAADGVDANSGSALDIQSDDATQGEVAALTAENAGERQAYGDQVQAMNDADKAGLYGAESDFTGQAAGLQTDRTLLSGATQGNWGSYFGM